MPKRGKGLTLVVVIAAAAAMVMAGCGKSTETAQVKPDVKKSGPWDLTGTMVNPHADTTGDEVKTLDMKAVAAGNLLAPPKGMTFTPDGCVNFILIDGKPLQTLDTAKVGLLNGIMQFNAASPVGKDHNLGHDNFFAHFVVEMPNGVDLAKIRETALACTAGTITLDGKVKGSITVVEGQAPTLQGAKTLTLKQTLTFAPTKDPATLAILKKYYGSVDADGGVNRPKHIAIVVMGNVIYFGIAPDAPLADRMYANFHKNASAKGIS